MHLFRQTRRQREEEQHTLHRREEKTKDTTEYYTTILDKRDTNTTYFYNSFHLSFFCSFSKFKRNEKKANNKKIDSKEDTL